MRWLTQRPMAAAAVVVLRAVVILSDAARIARASHHPRPVPIVVMVVLAVVTLGTFSVATRLNDRNDPAMVNMILLALVMTPLVECVAVDLAGGQVVCVAIAALAATVLLVSWLLRLRRHPVRAVSPDLLSGRGTV